MMKKNFQFALLSAIAFVGTLGFTACSSEDGLDSGNETINPNYDAKTGLVKSQFVLNIASSAQTRSGGTTVQAGGENFRGIDNTLLFAYTTSGKGFIDGTIAATEAASRYDLGMVAAANSLDNNGGNSHRILELAMPTGTDAMLFYGKAIKGSSTPDYNEIGKVSYNVSGKTATGFSFGLNSRVASTTDANKFKYTAELLAAIMTQIVSAQGSYTVNTTTFPDWTGAATLTCAWKDLNPDTQGRELTPLEEILYKAFHTLTSYGSNELRGGSSKAVLTTVRDLYAVTTKVVAATPTSPYEGLARNIAEAINTQITTYFTTTSTPIDGFKAVSGIKTSMGANWNSNWDAVVFDELANFPIETFTLPEGSAQLAYDATNNKFTHKTPGTSLLNKATTTDPSAYMYPSELMYYCNSDVRTSNKEKTSSSGYPNGVANWDAAGSWDTDWTGTSVTSATRATAMKKNVNYGVAMLQTTVGFKLGTGVTEFEDNRAALNTGETNLTFDPANIDFTWTGVIVGGQPASVDWQFLPTTTDFDKLVYDNRVTGLAAGTAVPTTVGATSSPNYTLLFDNYTTVATQNKVRVALQFVNNGDDFWGRANLIRKGQTFYLVAELDPTGKSISADNWDSYYQIPPLNASGVSTKTTRVFVQDYMTTANFKITNDATTKSLQNAYVTIPDLRSSQLSFGLSVDLDWRPGLTFDADLGGN